MRQATPGWIHQESRSILVTGMVGPLYTQEVPNLKVLERSTTQQKNEWNRSSEARNTNGPWTCEKILHHPIRPRQERNANENRHQCLSSRVAKIKGYDKPVLARLPHSQIELTTMGYLKGSFQCLPTSQTWMRVCQRFHI